ncbi:MAG: branched-chain amino acid ABC transporter permease [Acidobacteria bacterium]|nr:branched-chain amino acid ABC transporter permease [Acidobacteriota bacterium]MBV9478367.1 branched-chain amino acid ABC transporter permease [Acidobacteriota bacterium]
MQTLLQNLLNGIASGSIYALIALGYTMVYGILKLINFAHGDIFMLGSFVGFYAGNFIAKQNGGGSSPLSAALVMLLSMIVCGAFGYLNERIAYRPLRNAPRIASLITAIGVSFFLEFGGQFVFGPDPKFFPTLIDKHVIQFAGVVTTNYQLIVLGVAIAFMALLQYIVYGTKYGRAMRAVSYNFETASLMGIPTDRVISTTFVIGSMLAAVAGILYGLSYPKIDPLMGVMPGLKAFVAAVLGGIGNVPGAVVGGLLIGIIESFVGGSAYSNYRDAIAFVILIVILLFRPSGLFGKYQAEKV